ncbi:DUF5615 family PIN-like protein [Candidatus Daviesbacteria bacterium]|nr:DUF5615 family PIN-like protein [Candidatus Daviesbacteria bacterium]
MSSLTPNHKFLLDENVKRVLFRHLASKEFDVKIPPKSAKDTVVAKISKQEKRILVTNDSDFQWYDKDQIHSVILLNIPQNDTKSLISSFEKLLKEFNNFRGRIVLLEVNRWQDFPLWKEVS